MYVVPDLNKIPKETTFPVVKELIDEDVADEIIDNFSLLTQEELDKQIRITKETKWLSNLTVDEVDTIFDAPKYVPPTIEHRILGLFPHKHFDKDKVAATLSTNNDLQSWRHCCYKYNESELKNGFYYGFFSTCRCVCCDAILSCFPSPYKRIYWLQKNRCCFCSKIMKQVTEDEAQYCKHEAVKWQKNNSTNRFHHYYVPARK